MRILIIGPISDFGGRELETGFIAETLSVNHVVSIFSISDLTKESQVFDFFNGNVTSVKFSLYKKSIWMRIISLFSYIKNGRKGLRSDYINNGFNKKVLGYESKVVSLIQEKISSTDIVFINAQLSSNYIEEIINISFQKNKKIIFRTTGTISNTNVKSCLEKVDLFIHHSMSNANRLKISHHNYMIIDQCSFQEKSFLEVPLLDNCVKRFLAYGRLEKDKNFDVVINSFKKYATQSDQLYIIGKGSEEKALKKLAEGYSNIIFLGYLRNSEIINVLKRVECVIVPYYKLETGPLVGIEAMASGRVIISAKTGAMPERLDNLGFWFDNDIDSLGAQIVNVKSIDKEQVFSLSESIRNRYFKNHTHKKISDLYIESLDYVKIDDYDELYSR